MECPASKVRERHRLTRTLADRRVETTRSIMHRKTYTKLGSHDWFRTADTRFGGRRTFHSVSHAQPIGPVATHHILCDSTSSVTGGDMQTHLGVQGEATNIVRRHVAIHAPHQRPSRQVVTPHRRCYTLRHQSAPTQHRIIAEVAQVVGVAANLPRHERRHSIFLTPMHCETQLGTSHTHTHNTHCPRRLHEHHHSRLARDTMDPSTPCLAQLIHHQKPFTPRELEPKAAR